MPARRTLQLRRGRLSRPGSIYFVTECVRARSPVFGEATAARKAFDALQTIHGQKDAKILAATIMPDHIHLLFTLGTRLRLGQVLGKFKSFVREHGFAPWHWQEDGFEHELRTHESTEDYGFYIFMNPYRAGLLPLANNWPWWFCPDPQRFRFLSLLTGSVPREWVDQSIAVKSRLGIRR